MHSRMILPALVSTIAWGEVTPTREYWENLPTQTLDSLDPEIRRKVEAVMEATRIAGARLVLSEGGGRSRFGQYLAYWSWRIAKEDYRKSRNPEPPPFEGRYVDWFWKAPSENDVNPLAEELGVPSYVGAAIQLQRKYGQKRNPGLTCKLVEGKAVALHFRGGDQVQFTESIPVQGGDGRFHFIRAPQNIHDRSFDPLFASYGLLRIPPEKTDLDSGHGACFYYSLDGEWD
ncbi:MAG TPA: hypothetical protein VK188_16225 [Holophaga sp.]|nr:hypothetical protein [Holophaga sp.]